MRATSSEWLRRAEETIRHHGSGLPADQLLAEARVATRLRSAKVADEALSLGTTRFGGRPDLPASMPWPRWDGFAAPDTVLKNGTRIPQGCRPSALSFLAQLDLAEVPDATGLLPDRGWLLFFFDSAQQPWGFDPRDRGCGQVLYVTDDRASLRRIDPPPAVEQFASSALRAEVRATLPSWPSAIGLEVPEREYETYTELCERVAGPAPHHQLFGWPTEVQDSMERECQLVTNGLYLGGPDTYDKEAAKRLEPGAVDWVLLLQLDTDETGPGWMWGDCGCLYFWIRKQDLAARRFDNVWVILQCH